MSAAPDPCPGCRGPLRLRERASLVAGNLVYECRLCDRRFALGPSEEVLAEDRPEEGSGRTQRGLPRRPPEAGRLLEVHPPSIQAALPPGLRLTFEFVDGPERGRTAAVRRSRSVIGRGEGEIRIDDPLVSRRHAVVEVFGEGTILLTDLASTNGTYHDGRLIDRCKLHDGDEIRIGSTILNVTVERPAV